MDGQRPGPAAVRRPPALALRDGLARRVVAGRAARRARRVRRLERDDHGARPQHAPRALAVRAAAARSRRPPPSRAARSTSATTVAACSRCRATTGSASLGAGGERTRLRHAGGRRGPRVRAQLDRRLAHGLLDRAARCLWRRSTGSYVYSSPAVSRTAASSSARTTASSTRSRARTGATLWAHAHRRPDLGRRRRRRRRRLCRLVLAPDRRRRRGERPRRARLPARRVRARLRERQAAACCTATRGSTPWSAGEAPAAARGRRVLVLLAGGRGRRWYLHVKHASRDVQGSSTVEFVTTAGRRRRSRGAGDRLADRTATTRSGLRFANGISLAPPFRRVWTFRAQSLVEFPPAVAYGRLFFANNAGVGVRDRREERASALELRSRRCVAAVAGGRRPSASSRRS